MGGIREDRLRREKERLLEFTFFCFAGDIHCSKIDTQTREEQREAELKTSNEREKRCLSKTYYNTKKYPDYGGERLSNIDVACEIMNFTGPSLYLLFFNLIMICCFCSLCHISILYLSDTFEMHINFKQSLEDVIKLRNKKLAQKWSVIKEYLIILQLSG